MDSRSWRHISRLAHEYGEEIWNKTKHTLTHDPRKDKDPSYNPFILSVAFSSISTSPLIPHRDEEKHRTNTHQLELSSRSVTNIRRASRVYALIVINVPYVYFGTNPQAS